MASRLMRLVPLILVSAVVLVFFHRLAFTDMILARGDTYVYFYPYWDARDAALSAGQLPLWSNDIFMGVPLLANPQLGTFYPPNWLTIALSAPDAIRLSVLLHVVWAALGAYVLFRAVFAGRDETLLPGLAAALLYGLGGYIGAHVEQINQLQGLAWMPWAFWLLCRTLQADHWRQRTVRALLLALLLAVMIFTGHTQTIFITSFGLGLYAIGHSWLGAADGRWRRIVGGLLTLLLAAVVALLLALPQLLPTLELIGMSNRGGGFSVQQATAFSFNPAYTGRALLPAYDGQLFGEYVATLGVIGLGLALVGVLAGGRLPQRRIWVIIALVGLLFAFGRYNPLYWQIAPLPGFNLFRVPARWLALFALAMSLLAGLGLQVITSRRHDFSLDRLRFGLLFALLTGLMLLARYLPVDQVDIAGPALPSSTALLGWLIALMLLAAVLLLRWRLRPLWLATALLVMLAAELFLAALTQPYNDLAPREVYEGQRFTISQLMAYAEEDNPAGRTLPISLLYFEPGDKAALEARWRGMGMDDDAVRYAFVATKRQEMLFPNLSLRWGVPTVDGFGGGLLPTVYYSRFASLLQPPGAMRTLDGRMGELLALPDCRGACVPDQRWLDLTNTRYLVTDKVYDIWHDGVAFDTQLPQTVSDTFTDVYQNPDFVSTEVQVLFVGDAAPELQIRASDERLQLTAERVQPLDGLTLAVYALPEPLAGYELAFRADEALTVYAVTYHDARTGDFVQAVPSGWRRALSSDVKIYENLSVLPRAFLVTQGAYQPDNWQGHENALALMRDAGFDPAAQAIIHDPAQTGDFDFGPAEGQVRIETYEPTEIRMSVTSTSEAYVLLSDAWYPGWTATVDDQPAPVHRTDLMFRAVAVPAGQSTLVMRFEPQMWSWALYAGLGVGLKVGLVLLVLARRPRKPQPE